MNWCIVYEIRLFLFNVMMQQIHYSKICVLGMCVAYFEFCFWAGLFGIVLG